MTLIAKVTSIIFGIVLKLDTQGMPIKILISDINYLRSKLDKVSLLEIKTVHLMAGSTL